ncbi:hypothetical protein Tco_0915293 [Tanacetum coccineum]
MDIDDEEDKNEPELTFPYEEMNPLNTPPPASDSEPEDVIEMRLFLLVSMREEGESKGRVLWQDDFGFGL